MDGVVNLIELPLPTLVVLGMGYVGYRVAYSGHDGPHGPADILFLSLVFAAVTKACLVVFGEGAVGLIVSIMASLGAAVVWRMFGAPWSYASFRWAGISDHDRGRSVWESMLMRRLKPPTRLVIWLKDGGRLMCSDLEPFYGAPMGPCMFGPDGSVGLYITDVWEAGDSEWTELSPFDPEKPNWGYNMTIVPASEIARVQVRRPV